VCSRLSVLPNVIFLPFASEGFLPWTLARRFNLALGSSTYTSIRAALTDRLAARKDIALPTDTHEESRGRTGIAHRGIAILDLGARFAMPIETVCPRAPLPATWSGTGSGQGADRRA
jgi:hypothetical protein